MYYNRILRIWVLDQWDYFLISALIGSLVASSLKKYLSEEESTERLKNSIINKSKLIRSKTPILTSKKARKAKIEKIEKIYKFALNTRGGQMENFQVQHEFSNEVLNLAQQIKGIVERLAQFLKERELKGILKIFFRNGRLILELILYKCNIDITYSVLTQGLSTQVIVFTATVGGAAGFTLSWFSVGAVLVSPPFLISVLLLRSLTQQILNLKEYSDFKKLVNQMLDDDELKERIRAFFLEGEVENPISGILEMEPLDFDKNLPLKHDFESKSGEDLKEFIKERMEKELGLIENPTEAQLEEIIHRGGKRNHKGKTMYYKDFIKKILDEENNAELDVFDDVIDVDVVQEPQGIQIREKIRDEFE